MGRDFDHRRIGEAILAPPDPGLVKLVEALAKEQARRDHATDLAARRQSQDRTADASRRDLQQIFQRPSA